VRWAVDSITEDTGNEGKKVMRIVLIGISHWQTPFYSDPVLGMKDATIVGVSDPDAERAAPLAAQAKCPVSPIPRAGTRAAI
jgi:predicted dehydrogenase